jgi:hypothetical protein
MEDATAEDLDWFWRGWFYSTDVTDISLDGVKYAKAGFDGVPRTIDTVQQLDRPSNPFDDVSKQRNRMDTSIRFQTDVDTTLRDFYWRYTRGLEPYDSTKYPLTIQPTIEQLTPEERQQYANKHFYELTFSNKGGLVMPLIIEWTFKDGSKQIDRIPAQIWRLNEKRVVKLFMKDKEVAGIRLDPMRETADIDESNNSWGGTPQAPSRFQVFKTRQGAARGQSQGTNPMQKAQEKKGF